MVVINKERMTSFKGDILFIINGKAFMVSPEIELVPIFIDSTKENIYLFCTYYVKPHELPDGIKMDVEYTLRFFIENTAYLQVADLFQCVNQTREQLQLIYNEIFFSEIDKLLVPAIEFEDVSDYLNEVAQKIILHSTT